MFYWNGVITKKCDVRVTYMMTFHFFDFVFGPQVKLHLDFSFCLVKLSLADRYLSCSPAHSFSVTNKESVTRNLNSQSSFNAQISPPALSLHFTANWEFLFAWKANWTEVSPQIARPRLFLHRVYLGRGGSWLGASLLLGNDLWHQRTCTYLSHCSSSQMRLWSHDMYDQCRSSHRLWLSHRVQSTLAFFFFFFGSIDWFFFFLSFLPLDLQTEGEPFCLLQQHVWLRARQRCWIKSVKTQIQTSASLHGQRDDFWRIERRGVMRWRSVTAPRSQSHVTRWSFLLLWTMGSVTLVLHV